MNKPIDITNIVLNTSRLSLRLWRQEDLEDFFEYASMDGVGQMAGWNPHTSIEESEAILKRFIDGKHTFAIEKDGKVIGSLGVMEYSEENYPELSAFQGCEIGYALSKNYWGQGIMPEAVQAVIEFLFGVVELDFIIVGHFDWNKQSARVIEKCGFKYIKTVDYETQRDTVEKSEESILWNPIKATGEEK